MLKNLDKLGKLYFVYISFSSIHYDDLSVLYNVVSISLTFFDNSNNLVSLLLQLLKRIIEPLTNE